MKCPQCLVNQKYKDGMVCGSCGYQFALDPKIAPNISDMALKVAHDHLSGPGQDYFTYNQLYVAVYRMVERKKKFGVIETTLILFTTFFIISVILTGLLKTGWWLPVLTLIIALAGCIYLASRPFKISRSTIIRLINTYHAKNPPDRLVDGKQFFQAKPNGFEEEFLKYAPERILIVERNDLVDMMLLNRFHFENKTLILSAQKYPPVAFTACQNILAQHPEIPVCLMHDASEKGLRMKGRLVSDKNWNLEGKNIQDLGLFSHDVDRLKKPVWLATLVEKPNQGPEYPTGKTAMENISQGFTMPVDAAPPRTMKGAVALAITTGLVLLSEKFLAEQARNAKTDNGLIPGYGSG